MLLPAYLVYVAASLLRHDEARELRVLCDFYERVSVRIQFATLIVLTADSCSLQQSLLEAARLIRRKRRMLLL